MRKRRIRLDYSPLVRANVAYAGMGARGCVFSSESEICARNIMLSFCLC